MNTITKFFSTLQEAHDAVKFEKSQGHLPMIIDCANGYFVRFAMYETQR